jgi:hypothetical protein
MSKKLEAFELDSWAEKLSRWSPKQVKAAFDQYMETHEFWPKPAQIIQILEADKETTGAYKPFAGVQPIRCELCSDTGLTDGGLDKRGNRQMVRCGCKEKRA